jgi:hypothetical protein
LDFGQQLQKLTVKNAINSGELIEATHFVVVGVFVACELFLVLDDSSAIIISQQSRGMLRFLVATAAAVCIGASSEWTAPKEIDISNSPHKHEEDHASTHVDHNAKDLSSEVKYWKHYSELPTCPSSR